MPQRHMLDIGILLGHSHHEVSHLELFEEVAETGKGSGFGIVLLKIEN